mmetsp:Transcript_123011/g.382956  ORF Transcript_123011/g.382956 Transcript_123011/m.382956 type:complete len:248 (+) Transcript_123011:951-1694(+)
MRGQLRHDAQLSLDGEELIHVLDGRFRDHLHGPLPLVRVLGPEHGTESALAQQLPERVVLNADVILEALFDGRVHGRDALEHLAWKVPHELVPGSLQGLPHLLLCNVHLLAHQHGRLPGRELRPHYGLRHPVTGDHLLAAQAHDVVSPPFHEGPGNMHLEFPSLRQLLALVEKDRYARRHVRKPVHGPAAVERHLRVRPVVHHHEAADVRGEDGLVAAGAQEVIAMPNVREAHAVQLLGVQLGLRED